MCPKSHDIPRHQQNAKKNSAIFKLPGLMGFSCLKPCGYGVALPFFLNYQHQQYYLSYPELIYLGKLYGRRRFAQIFAAS